MIYRADYLYDEKRDYYGRDCPDNHIWNDAQMLEQLIDEIPVVKQFEVPKI